MAQTPRKIKSSIKTTCAPLKAMLERYRDVIDKWGLAAIIDNRNRHHTDRHFLEQDFFGNYIRQIMFGHNYRFHREDGPAHIVFDERGRICRETYYLNGEAHRENEPACFVYDEKGNIVEKVYWHHGRSHRIGGPARITPQVKEYFIQGVRVGRKLAMHPKCQTLRQVNNETNAEVKRLRIEFYGWERYLADMKAKVIDHCVDEVSQTSQSLMMCYSGREYISVLVCACPSTARVYAVEVPALISTCQKAQEWLRGPTMGNVQIIGAS